MTRISVTCKKSVTLKCWDPCTQLLYISLHVIRNRVIRRLWCTCIGYSSKGMVSNWLECLAIDADGMNLSLLRWLLLLLLRPWASPSITMPLHLIFRFTDLAYIIICNIIITIITVIVISWHTESLNCVQEMGSRIKAVTRDLHGTSHLLQRLSIALQIGNCLSSASQFGSIRRQMEPMAR